MGHIEKFSHFIGQLKIRICFLVLGISLLTVCISDAKEYTVKDSLKAYIYNDLLKQQIPQPMHVNIETSDDSILWYVDYSIFPIAISLDKKARSSLLNLITKYKEWNKKATAQGVQLDKDLGNIESLKIYFKSGNDWHSDEDATIQCRFFSNSKQKHQLVIFIHPIKSSANEYITQNPSELYFSWSEVIQLESAFSDKAITTYKSKVSKKQQIEDSFK